MIDEDMLPRIVPVAVGVEVNPRVQYPGGRGRDGRARGRGNRRTQQRGVKHNPILIVVGRGKEAVRVVTQSGRVGLPICIIIHP